MSGSSAISRASSVRSPTSTTISTARARSVSRPTSQPNSARRQTGWPSSIKPRASSRRVARLGPATIRRGTTAALTNAGGRITAENALANYLIIHGSTANGGVIGAEGGTLVLDGSTITNAQIEANSGGSLQIINAVDASTSTFG